MFNGRKADRGPTRAMLTEWDSFNLHFFSFIKLKRKKE